MNAYVVNGPPMRDIKINKAQSKAWDLQREPKAAEVKGDQDMKNMEIQERRPISPNVRMVSREVFHRFAAWFKAGLGLGLMLFTA